MKVYERIVDTIGNTPLVELKNIEEKYNLKAKIIAKVESFNPAGSVKDRIARSECCLSDLDLTVYDENGCIVPLAGTKTGCCGTNNLSSNSKSSSTGSTPIVSNETLYQIQDNSRNGEDGGKTGYIQGQRFCGSWQIHDPGCLHLFYVDGGIQKG